MKILALIAELAFTEGCMVLSFDGIIAFNSMYRHSILAAPAEIITPIGRHAINIYKREPS